jgi:hypothetical protein
MDGNDNNGDQTPEEQSQHAFMWLRAMELRIATVENLLLELLFKLKDAGLIADNEDNEDETEE